MDFNLNPTDTLLSDNRTDFFNFFSSIFKYQTHLASLNTWWDKVSLVGKINSLNVPQSLLGNMLETKSEFAELQETLIDNLLSEQLEQCYLKNLRIAQTLVNIPNRNLFERTADVGFLATDVEVVKALESDALSDDALNSMRHRLNEYAAKYSVYDEIILLDVNGNSRVSMSGDGELTNYVDPIIGEVLSENQEYWEICRYSSLMPNKSLSSLFLAPVKSLTTNKNVGVLCLSFKLHDEMTSLFNEMDDGAGCIFCLLDHKGYVLVSSDTDALPVASALKLADEHQIISLNGQRYLASFAKTQGYQGYIGLGWIGCSLLPLLNEETVETNQSDSMNETSHWKGFSPVLSDIRSRARIVTDDLDLVVLNGRIAAARSDADEFIPILEEIRNIGRQMQDIFSSSVSRLMDTALVTRYGALEFQAAQSIDIFDRNLYERANDCRWWALTSLFVEYLSTSNKSRQSSHAVHEVLSYINSLYTVYSGIYLYDASGKICAVSNEGFHQWRNQTVSEQSNWKGVLSLTDSQQYCVSKFQPSQYYNDQGTYIYNAAIRHNQKVLGGIGLVFDSKPQFQAMLDDVLAGTSLRRHGIFVDRSGNIVGASRHAPWRIGNTIALPKDILHVENGVQGSGIYKIEGDDFIVGYACSKGYREYKTSDGYSNDVISVIFEANKRVKH